MDKKEKKYPLDFSDKEIFEEAELYANKRIYDDDPGATARALRCMVALTEIQRRSSKRVARWSIILSVTVIILSLIAVYFSYNAYKTSIDWQVKQLQILEEIRNDLK